MKTSYQEAGVSIDAGNQFVEAIKPLIRKTKRPEVMTPIGGFASLFSLNKQKYPDPVLVSSTDGVGTKLKLAQAMGRWDSIGADLVAMCVNDLICVGAEPLFFLDYYACGKLDPEKAVPVIAGMTDALASIQCALVGGETAEMPGVYQPEEFDLAGFAVGIVNRDAMIDGSGISIGNKVIGLSSSGVHSNGFSLVRKLIADHKLDLEKTYPGFERSLGEVLLEPTRLYVNPILNLQKQIPIRGLAHITGGGLLENIPRILPEKTRVTLDRSKWTAAPIFSFLQSLGEIEDAEMQRVFNCGIGMVVIVDAEHASDALARFQGGGYPAQIIGEVSPRQNNEAIVTIL